MSLVERFQATLEHLSGHMRPWLMTKEEFLGWQEREPDAPDALDAEDFARFVRAAAEDGQCETLIRAADEVLRIARAISRRPVPLDPETGFEVQTLPYSEWKRAFDARAKGEEERLGRAARWEAKEVVTTSDIANLLWPDEGPGFGTTYVYGLLRELGYVEGRPRAWSLTAKGAQHGELRGPRRYIYWRKTMLDVVRSELRRRGGAGISRREASSEGSTARAAII